MLCGPSRTAVDGHADLKALIESGAVQWMEPQPTPSLSAYEAMRVIPETSPILLTTADHALLTPQILDFFCSGALVRRCDVVVGLASHDLVASAFPGVGRTAIQFQEGGYCGCNLYAFLTPRARAAAAFWQRVERQRKTPWRLISTLGLIPVLRYAVGRLTIRGGLAGISRRLSMRVEAVMMPFPEAAVDVDKVSDLALVEKVLGGHVS